MSTVFQMSLPTPERPIIEQWHCYKDSIRFYTWREEELHKLKADLFTIAIFKIKFKNPIQ